MLPNKTLQIQNELKVLFDEVAGRYALIRIPKTASASMSRAVFNAGLGTNIKTDYEAPPFWWDHYSAKFCIETLGNDNWNNAFTFSIVRNPFARLYSNWKYWHCTAMFSQDHDPAVNQFMDLQFSDWIMGGCHEHCWNQPHHSMVFPKNPLLSQFGWIGNTDGEYLVDVALRLEELEHHGIPILRQVFGNHFRMPKTKINATAHADEYQHFYTPELIEKAGDLCHDDIVKFGYTFDGIA